MDWLKKLQELYKSGKLTKEKYEAKVKDALEDELVSQEEHDEALKFDPKASSDAVYTEEDMQRMAYNVARRIIRKAAKDKGLEIDADNKSLVDKLVEMASNGKDGKGATATEAEIAQLRKDAGKVTALQKQLAQANLELGVLSHTAAFNPHNPAQVVRALQGSEYRDLLDIDDETGAPTPASVKSALQKLSKAEPNLFKAAGSDGGTDDQDDEPPAGGFRGKAPGGAASGGGGGAGKKGDELTNEALKMLGINQQQK